MKKMCRRVIGMKKKKNSKGRKICLCQNMKPRQNLAMKNKQFWMICRQFPNSAIFYPLFRVCLFHGIVQVAPSSLMPYPTKWNCWLSSHMNSSDTFLIKPWPWYVLPSIPYFLTESDLYFHPLFQCYVIESTCEKVTLR